MMWRFLWRMVFSVVLGCSLVAPAWAAEQDEECLNCHMRDATQSRRQIDLGPLMKSVHGGQVSCVECHPTSQQESHQQNTSVTPANCQGCHDQKSLHGHKSGKSALCSQCHGGHDILPQSAMASTDHVSKLARTCGRCHPDKFGNGSVAGSIIGFRVRGHPKADLSRHYSRRECLACHRPEVGHERTAQTTALGCRSCHQPDNRWARYLGTFHGPGSLGTIQASRHVGDMLYMGLLAGSLVVFSWGWAKRFRIWKKGKPSRRWDHLFQRLSKCMKAGLVQRSVFNRKIAGLSHYLIFLGVAIPIVIIVVAQARPVLGPWPARLVSLLLDVMGLGLLCGLCLALFRRVWRQGELPEQGLADAVVLGLLLCVVITGFGTEGFRLATSPADESDWSPVGRLLALALPSSAEATAVMWRVHFLLVLAFLSAMPWTRLRHLIFAPLNIFFSTLGPPGRLEPIDVNSGERFGVSRATDLTWKDLLDSDTCMACGRCQEACPAYATDKPLSPLKVIQGINGEASNPSAPDRGNAGLQDGLHARISADETWACTTCYACQEACPVSVEHVGKLMGLRRSLVMDQGRVPREGIRFLRNLEVFGDPTGYGQAMRRQWAQSLPARLFDKESEPSLLYWVGCQAAFHPRAQETARALMKVADRAGVRLTILGEEEMCCGDPARRLGEEALFQELAQRNIKRFRAHGIKRIVTLCPHCFNTLTNEYPDFGADIEVVHAVEWAANLLKSGRIKIHRSLEKKCAFHDPCYLSRVNKLSRFSRDLAGAVPGLELLEMSKNQEQTFCCGAGGGHMWLHESGRRINQARSEQCMQTVPDLVGTACPYCLTMLEDGLKEVASGPVVVRDLMEILEVVTR
jgi:Fe-S oxidoreductase/nitrate reductase gamma subunit